MREHREPMTLLSSPVLEMANLDVIPDREAEFEVAFVQAVRLIASIPGCQGHVLRRCVENPLRYLMLIGWERLEDHTKGFRNSPEYLEWSVLLHPYYDPFPVVEHYEVVCGENGAPV
ncbi:MAG: antibiotic biosynthesis monooxygenase family protein [Candidatus Thiodiazotropha taylori]